MRGAGAVQGCECVRGGETGVAMLVMLGTGVNCDVTAAATVPRASPSIFIPLFQVPAPPQREDGMTPSASRNDDAPAPLGGDAVGMLAGLRCLKGPAPPGPASRAGGGPDGRAQLGAGSGAGGARPGVRRRGRLPAV